MKLEGKFRDCVERQEHVYIAAGANILQIHNALWRTDCKYFETACFLREKNIYLNTRATVDFWLD